MTDEIVTIKKDWYDVTKYKDEIQSYVIEKRRNLDCLSTMESNYTDLYKSVFSGSVEAETERFPHAAEMFKVYKASIIDTSLSGYSALLEITGDDAYSVLQSPHLKEAMTKQFKAMALLEKVSGDILDDWILKGECVCIEKLVEEKELYRRKQTLTDMTTNEPVAVFKMIEGITTSKLGIDRIDPLDFYVDAYDYEKDPLGCTKIIRSWIDDKTLLTSTAYPLLSKEDKDAIIESRNNKNKGYPYMWSSQDGYNQSYSATDKDRIEVLTFYGDYITSDKKVLSNIRAVIVQGKIAKVEYNPVSVNRIIYAGYKIDRDTHRSISPLACAKPINELINRATDMFLKNLEDISVPYMLYAKGSINTQDIKKARKNREIEYIDNGSIPPQFWSPQPAAQSGLQLLEMVLSENKNVLGINNYITGDSGGAVRTAKETAALRQAANTRMRVETDVFSYKFMLPLFVSFYSFNRELALNLEKPLDPIYQDLKLRVTISTNASRADKEGELQRLMQMLQLPIAQMIFSNLNPEQVVLAVRYLMAKAELTDVDNLLELVDKSGNPQFPTLNKDGEPTIQEITQNAGINDITMDSANSGATSDGLEQ